MHQDLLGALAQGRWPVGQALAIGFQEVAGQRQNISRSLAQGQQRKADNIQAVIEILAEMSGIDGLLQVDVGGSQHPNVDRGAFARTQPHNLLFLQDAQQLDLDGQRQVADFIQKQRAAIGLFKPAGFCTQGARESTFFMAEQLSLNQ